jgi:aminopeptidase N
MLRRAFTTAATRTRAVKLSDYAPFPFTIDSVHLDFKLGSTTEITSTLVVSKASLDSNAVLSLDGQDLSTVDVQLSGSTLTEGKDYTITTKPDGDNVMSIYPPPHDDPFEVRINTLRQKVSDESHGTPTAPTSCPRSKLH